MSHAKASEHYSILVKHQGIAQLSGAAAFEAGVISIVGVENQY